MTTSGPRSSYTLLGGRLRLLNHPELTARPAEDPLWLAATVPPLPETAHVLDAGTGTGVLGLALHVFQPKLRLTLLDADPALTHLAANNATVNRLPAKIITHNFLALPEDHVWDAVISNPPYHLTKRGHRTPSARKTMAHSAPEGLAEQWLAASLRHTHAQGSIHLVAHPAFIEELKPHCTHLNAHLVPLATASGKPPKRALLHLYKGRPAGWQEHPELPAYRAPLRESILKNATPHPIPAAA